MEKNERGGWEKKDANTRKDFQKTKSNGSLEKEEISRNLIAQKLVESSNLDTPYSSERQQTTPKPNFLVPWSENGLTSFNIGNKQLHFERLYPFSKNTCKIDLFIE